MLKKRILAMALVLLFCGTAAKAAEPITIDAEGDFAVNGKKIAMLGINYTKFNIDGMNFQADYGRIRSDIERMYDMGITVIRIPINAGFLQPGQGIFPDNPLHKKILAEHDLNDQWMECLDYFIDYAGSFGMYSVLEYHDFPVDPFRYHFGGYNNHAVGTGVAGKAPAWMARDMTQSDEFNITRPLHYQALIDCHRWLARHYKGNPNIAFFEVPWNEPHDQFMSIEDNYRAVTKACVDAVKSEDPDRICMAMPAGWGHDNVTKTITWMLDSFVDGNAPHFYMANGPVPLRDDYQQYNENWLARDYDQTMEYSAPAMLLPFTAVDYPVFLGEGGDYGNETILPQYPADESAEIMLEAATVQFYGMDTVGFTSWTIWDDPTGFAEEAYKKVLPRYADVYKGGKVVSRDADIAFVQNQFAATTENGHNYACVPIAKLAMDLHLLPGAHYYTEDQFQDKFSPTNQDMPLQLPYKAVVADKRNMTDTTIQQLEAQSVPVLLCEDITQLTKEELAAFLTDAGVVIDQKTSEDIWVIEAPNHLVLYRRKNESNGSETVYPMLKHAGQFSLVDEQGGEVFRGTAQQLHETGFAAEVKKWEGNIYRFVPLADGGTDAVVEADTRFAVFVNGDRAADVQPRVENGALLLPLRAAAEAVGATVDWNGEARAAEVHMDGKTTSIFQSGEVLRGGAAYRYSAAHGIWDGTLYVPYDLLADACGYRGSLDEITAAVYLTR